MTKTAQTRVTDFVLCFALRHLDAEREILVLKVKGQNFYVFPPYAKKPLGDLDCHMSWHESGERHAVARYYDGRVWQETFQVRKESIVILEPPASVTGAVLLFHSGVFSPQLRDLPPVGTNVGDLIVLDTDASNFRDDFIAVKVHLIQPDAEHRIEVSQEIGPRILHLVKRTAPWIAVEVFQQSAPESLL
jgi:hypothetical protein